MLNLFALTALHSIIKDTVSDDTKSSESVQLTDVYCFFTEKNAISVNRTILKNMIWSFFRAVTHVLSSDVYSFYIRFLNFVFAVINVLKHNSDKILNHYWMKNFFTSLNHVNSMIEIWKNVQSVFTFIEFSIKYAEIKKRLNIKADNKTNNYNTSFTQIDNMFFVKQIENRCGIYNFEYHILLL